MNNQLRYFGVLCKEYLSSPLCYMSVVLFVLLCAFGNSADVGGSNYSVLELITDRELYRQACTFMQCSSYILTLRYDAMPWFSVVVPVITAFPALMIYEQNSGGICTSILSRIKKQNYCGSLFITAFLSGFLIAMLGIVLYAVLMLFYFPSITAFDDEILLSFYGSTMLERFVPLLKKGINCCFVCGVFPVLTVSIYNIVHDRFLAMTFPMMLQYISLKCSILYASWLYSDPSRASDRLLNLFHLLFPSNCMSHYSFWENNLQLPFLCFFIIIGALLVVLYIIFERLIRLSVGGRI